MIGKKSEGRGSIYGNDKLAKMEKILDFCMMGNSAFTLLVSTIIPIYFNALAEMQISKSGLSGILGVWRLFLQ